MPIGDLRVLQSQRDEVLQRLTDAGLEPHEFRWEHVEGSVTRDANGPTCPSGNGLLL